jgi:hypothetical protein
VGVILKVTPPFYGVMWNRNVELRISSLVGNNVLKYVLSNDTFFVLFYCGSALYHVVSICMQTYMVPPVYGCNQMVGVVFRNHDRSSRQSM